MEFEKKFRALRREAGVSQEKIAEVLDVSRQAVAKWEAGTTMPEITHLLGLSEFFQVSLDYLMKKSSSYRIPDTANTKAEYAEIIEFLVEAKKSTYAAGENALRKEPPSRLGATELFYEKGAYQYLDTFVGGTHFSGEEVVWHQEVPIWAMNYSGRVLDNKLGNFLKEALLQVSPKAPYRGPALYRKGKYTYVNTPEGDFAWFRGAEKIFYEETMIYELVYHGGCVKA